MALTYVGNGTTVEADNATVTPDFGSTAQASDIALAFGAIRTGTTGRTLSASGYSTIASYGGSGQQPMYLFGKVAAASEAAPSVVPAGGAAGDVVQAVGILLRGAMTNLASIVHSSATSSNSSSASTPINTPALTITEDNCLVLVLVTYQLDATSFGAFDPAAGTWEQKVFTSTTTGGNQAIAVYVSEQTTAASLSASTISISGQATGVTARVLAVALRAGGGGGSSIAAIQQYYQRLRASNG